MDLQAREITWYYVSRSSLLGGGRADEEGTERGAAPSNTVGPCTYTHIRSTPHEKLSVVMTRARSTAPTSPTPQRPRRTPQRQPKRQPKRQPSKPTRVPNPTRREPSTPDPDRREPSTPSPSSGA